MIIDVAVQFADRGGELANPGLETACRRRLLDGKTETCPQCFARRLCARP
jgi:hypothetical protein